MRVDGQIQLPIPDDLVDEIADRVAEKVVVRIAQFVPRQPILTREPPPTGPDPHRPEPTFLRLREVAARIGVARGTIYQWMAEDRFPRAVQLGGRSVAWRRVDLENWEACPEAYVSAVDSR